MEYLKEVYEGLPLLFFISNLPDVVSSTVQIFAEYTKLYRTVNDIGDLNKLYQWPTKWHIQFNAKKCKVKPICSRNSKAEYTLDVTTLDAVTDENDMGF